MAMLRPAPRAPDAMSELKNSVKTYGRTTRLDAWAFVANDKSASIVDGAQGQLNRPPFLAESNRVAEQRAHESRD